MAIGVLLAATVWGGLSILAAEASLSRQEERSDEAMELAEAGLPWAIARLERDRAYSGEEGRAFGPGSFDVVVDEVQGRPEARRVRVAGRVPAAHGLDVTSAFAGLLERVETPKGPVWRRLAWRTASR